MLTYCYDIVEYRSINKDKPVLYSCFCIILENKFVFLQIDGYFYKCCNYLVLVFFSFFTLVLCVCFVDRCFVLCPFYFGHSVVCPLIYGIWLPLWYLQTLLTVFIIDHLHIRRRTQQHKMLWRVHMHYLIIANLRALCI